MTNRRIFLSMLGSAGFSIVARSSLADPQAEWTKGAEIVRRFASAGIPVHSFTLKSSSMLPTLAPEDSLLADMRATESGPARGALVVFRRATGDPWVKRVIGLPGDRIAFKNRRLILNGRELALDDVGDSKFETGHGSVTLSLKLETLPGARPYQIATGADLANAPLNPADLPETEVASGRAYVLGDNRGNSMDSRWPAFGTIAIGEIVGQIVYRFSPNAGWLVPEQSLSALPPG